MALLNLLLFDSRLHKVDYCKKVFFSKSKLLSIFLKPYGYCLISKNRSSSAMRIWHYQCMPPMQRNYEHDSNISSLYLFLKCINSLGHRIQKWNKFECNGTKIESKLLQFHLNRPHYLSCFVLGLWYCPISI